MATRHSNPEPDRGQPKGLTGIPTRIHWAATDDTPDSEADRTAIDQFLDALAEVALAVATRNAQPDGTQEA